MFLKIAEGDVYATREENRVMVGSRTAVLPDGRIACTFNIQTKIGGRCRHDTFYRNKGKDGNQ